MATYPLVQLGSTQNAQKIRYLCVAGTDRVVRYSVDDPTILDASMSPSDKRLSIHLCFDRRVNFKRKFLNDLFPGKYLNQSYHTLVFSFVELKLPDYLLTENADQFNTEIKSVSKGNVMESSVYMSKNKKEKKSSANGYNQQRDEIATDAFNQSSITSGWFISFWERILHAASPLGAALLKKKLAFHYLSMGRNLRENLNYELEEAKKQEEIEYKPPHDPNTYT